jgi:hypothetical protein
VDFQWWNAAIIFWVPYFHTKMRNKKHMVHCIFSLFGRKICQNLRFFWEKNIHQISNWVLEGVREGGHLFVLALGIGCRN